MKYCQGPSCHTYASTDRIRGPKGDKRYETRRRSEFYYGNGNFCTLNCQNDWFRKFGNLAVDHFGRLHEPKRLVPENAWQKDYDWDYNNGNGIESNWRFVNKLTKEIRPITQEQYEDVDFTINQG
jgi:hypothetical protein|tara:strand:+ start:259 stop:633 length:375 start_codon:yes stop_codon:yes gene_type:complete